MRVMLPTGLSGHCPTVTQVVFFLGQLVLRDLFLSSTVDLSCHWPEWFAEQGAVVWGTKGQTKTSIGVTTRNRSLMFLKVCKAAGWEFAPSSGSDQRTCYVPGLLLSGPRGPRPYYSPLPHSWTASSLTSLLNSICQRKGIGSKNKTWWGPSIMVIKRFFNFESQAGAWACVCVLKGWGGWGVGGLYGQFNSRYHGQLPKRSGYQPVYILHSVKYCKSNAERVLCQFSLNR